MKQEQDLNCYFENLRDIVRYLEDPDILEEEEIRDLLFVARTDEKELKSYLERNFGMKILDYPNGEYQYYIP